MFESNYVLGGVVITLLIITLVLTRMLSKKRSATATATPTPTGATPGGSILPTFPANTWWWILAGAVILTGYLFWSKIVSIEAPSVASVVAFGHARWLWLVFIVTGISAIIALKNPAHQTTYHKVVWGVLGIWLFAGQVWVWVSDISLPNGASAQTQCEDLGAETRTCLVDTQGTRAMKIESHLLGRMEVCNFPALPYRLWEEGGTTYWKFWTTGGEVEFKYKLFPVGTDCSQVTL
jgi:hypothetical protein